MARILAVLSAFLVALLPCDTRGDDAILIPHEDDRWDSQLRRAMERVRAGDHRRGVQILQEVLGDTATRSALKVVGPDGMPPELTALFESDRPGERLVGSRASDPRDRARLRGVTLYVPVAVVARKLLASLPPDAVRVYRELYGGVAKDLQRRAARNRDGAELRRLAEDYFLSDEALDARDWVAETHFEEGKFRLALSVWRSIVGEDLPERRALEIRFKILKALYFLGEREAYQKEKESFLSAVVSPVGVAVEGAESFLQRLLIFETSVSPVSPPAVVAVAPGMPSGPAPALPGRQLKFEWNSYFAPRTGLRHRPTIGTFPVESLRRRQDPSFWFPYFPTFGPGGQEGYLYLNQVLKLERFSVTRGTRELPNYRFVPNGPPSLGNFVEGSESPLYVATVGDPRLPADAGGMLIRNYLSDLVEFRHYLGYEITAEIPIRSLVAFNGATGNVLWDTGDLTLDSRGPRAGGSGKRAVSFTTPALSLDRKVIAAGWQQHGYLNGLLVALNQRTGKLLWSQLLTSCQMEMTMFGELAREPLGSCLIESEGVIYVSTNLGAVAAVDADTGRVLWLTTYESLGVRPTGGRRSEFRTLVWGPNPPLLVGNTLFVTPRDSDSLYAIDCDQSTGITPRQGGRILWRYRNTSGEMRDLLGYSSSTGYLYFSGPGGVMALDIRGIPEQPPRVIRGPRNGDPQGRGALTDGGVLMFSRERVSLQPGIVGGSPVADPGRLWLMDLELKKALDLFASSQLPRSFGTYGGNVTVWGGKVYLVSRDLIAAFSPVPEPGVRPQAGEEL